MTNPTFVFVPGILHTPEHFQPIITELAKRQYDAVAVSINGTGANAIDAGPFDNVQSVKDAIQEKAKGGTKVILVAHSNGGIPASQAIRGMPSVIGAVFIAAFIIKEGETGLGTMTRLQVPKTPAFSFDPSNYKQLIATDKAGEIFFSDLDVDQREQWASKLQPSSVAQGMITVPHGTWNSSIPKRYIFTRGEDKALPFYSQWAMLNEVDDGSWSTTEMDCGHSPFLSHIRHLADILEGFASRLQEEEA